jgi:hypothetical protein
MNHLLAHFSDIVAKMLQDLAKERSGERKKNERRCYAKLCEKAHPLKALGCVAGFLRNSKFYLINDKRACCTTNIAAPVGEISQWSARIWPGGAAIFVLAHCSGAEYTPFRVRA